MDKLKKVFFSLLFILILTGCHSPKQATGSTISHEEVVASGDSSYSEDTKESKKTGLVTMSVSQEEIVLTYIDPTTGEWLDETRFVKPSLSDYNVEFSEDLGVRKLSPLYNQQAFDGEYTKTAVTIRRQKDNVRQVGYIDEFGNLINVSELLFPDDDEFSVSPHMENPKISSDGYFWFLEVTEISKDRRSYELKKVKLDDISKDTVETVESIESGHYHVMSDGRQITENSKGNLKLYNTYGRWYAPDNQHFLLMELEGAHYNPASANTVVGTPITDYYSYYVSDFLGNDFFIDRYLNVHKTFAEPISSEEDLLQEKNWQSIDNGDYSTFVRNLLPENQRKNITPVTSPDNKQVAFLSADRGTNGMGEYGLYLVDSNGGTPTKLEGYSTFQGYTGDDSLIAEPRPMYVLLDWVE